MSAKLFKATVSIRPLAQVVDPEGLAIRTGLLDLGYSSVTQVRAGKLIEVELAAASTQEAEALVREMSQKLLANPLIESFEIHVESAAGTPA